MRRQRYQPGIQNGLVAKRRTRSKNTVTSKARVLNVGATRPSSRSLSNRLRRRRRDKGRGSSVMWMMILIGAALSAGFIFALRSQINTHKIAQAEERLKTKLDEYASQQKFLELDQQRALNTDESDRAGRRSGLDQLKLDRAAQPGVIVNQVPSPLKAHQTGLKAHQTGLKAPQTGLKAPQTGLKAPQTGLKATQTGQKAAKVVKVVKSGATKSPKARVVSAPIVKVKKQSNRQRQALRSQPRR